MSTISEAITHLIDPGDGAGPERVTVRVGCRLPDLPEHAEYLGVERGPHVAECGCRGDCRGPAPLPGEEAA